MCTIFSLAQDATTLIGNNEDFNDPHTAVWYVRPQGGEMDGQAFARGRYGRVYFGYRRMAMFMQGGMNDAGVFFDYTACPFLPMTRTIGKPVFEGDLMEPAMAECGTVDEVLAFLDRYHWPVLERASLLLADASGASVILEGDKVFRKQGRYQVLTNFHQSRTTAEEAGCTRFQIASAMLARDPGASVDRVRGVLSAVHQEGLWPTVYSNIYDLKRRLVYLYHFHDFEHVVEIDLAAELERGARTVDLPGLFPGKHAADLFMREIDFGLRRDEVLSELRASGAIRRVGLDVLEPYLGRYKAVQFEEIVIELVPAGDRVFCTMTATGGREFRPTQELYPASESSFVSPQVGGLHTYSFEKDESGRVARLVIDMGRGRKTVAERVGQEPNRADH